MVSQYKCSTISLVSLKYNPGIKKQTYYIIEASMNMHNAHIMKMPSKTPISFYFFKIFIL
jgi:hypothetical protein